VNPVNHQLLLIDPWVSLCSVRFRWMNKDALKRIDDFADWIITRLSEGYQLSGILLSHDHFDHVEDIPYLVKRINGSRPGNHPEIVIHCDSGTCEKLTKISDGADLCFSPIKNGDIELYYNDTEIKRRVKHHMPGYPLKAGTILNTFTAGSFNVTPYIWDHSKTSVLDTKSMIGPASGGYERISAFLIERKVDDTVHGEQKQTFIIGSAGEMSSHHDGVPVLDTNINPHVLLQAIPRKVILNCLKWRDYLNQMVTYQAKNIAVQDTVAVSHFETFIGDKDGPGELYDNLE